VAPEPILADLDWQIMARMCGFVHRGSPDSDILCAANAIDKTFGNPVGFINRIYIVNPFPS
jgi:hypothetical protein